MSLQRKLRVSAISFLNTAPLMYDFTHAPRSVELASRYEVHFTLPNLCAEQLASGAADIGLVPVAALTTNPGLSVLPGVAIAALDEVRSILLVTRRGLALKDVQSVALDSTSRTSAALVKVIFQKFIGTTPRYAQAAPDLASMLSHHDAALLIGDPALLAREAGVCADHECHDLAQIWRQRTGLPFVFAVWAMHPQALAGLDISAENVARDFQQSRDHGVANLATLLPEWSSRVALPAAVIDHYWRQNIHYTLDAECLEGMKLFFQYAQECGVLPATPASLILSS